VDIIKLKLYLTKKYILHLHNLFLLLMIFLKKQIIKQFALLIILLELKLVIVFN